MAESSQQYIYLPLADAKKCVGQQVSLFAAVAEIGGSKKSRGTDYVLTLKIVDQSYSALGLSVNFFAENTSKLPHIRSSGDIICLHHVLMKVYNGEQYGVFNKRVSSFALFDRQNAEEFSPYQTSTKYCATDQDAKTLLQLRKWLLDRPIDEAFYDTSLQLRFIKSGQVFDLVCKVLHVYETGDGEWMLFVWDGTDAPPVSPQTDLNIEGETPCSLHPDVLSLTREILLEFPSVGTVLRISAGRFLKEIADLQGSVRWIKLCEICYELQSGIWKGVLQPSSKVCYLSDEDATVLRCRRFYEDRMASMVQRWPLTSFPYPSHIIETDFEHVAYSTLRQSLTHPQVTHRCKCIVRVIAAYPWWVQELWSQTKGHYRVRLTLEDPTARIHAYICEEDADYFFGRQTSRELAINMHKLLGISDDASRAEGSRDPPWVYCCLKSYYMDKCDPWGSRRYRVFGTRLVG